VCIIVKYSIIYSAPSASPLRTLRENLSSHAGTTYATVTKNLSFRSVWQRKSMMNLRFLFFFSKQHGCFTPYSQDLWNALSFL